MTAPLPLYRAGVQTFLDPATFAGGRHVWANDAAGNRVTVDGVLTQLGEKRNRKVKAIWAGNAAGTLGMYAVPVRMEVDGRATTSAHFLTQTHGVNDEFILHVNPLDPAANLTPTGVTSVRMTIRYAPQANFAKYARG